MSLIKLINYLTLSTILGVLITLFSVTSEMYPGPGEYPNHAHVKLYVDRNFSPVETEIIMEAAFEWSQATNHIVEYDVIRLPTKEKIDYTHSVFIVKRSVDDPTIILMDVSSQTETLGVYQKQGLAYISLVSYRLNEENYKKVVLHELGHSLGISHLSGNKNINTLMYPYTNIILEDGTIIPAGSDRITKKDLEAFCKLYHCDANLL
jgi:hypothetical protein